MEDGLWMIGALALMVRVGMALFHCGLCRSKNAASAVLRAVLETSVAVLAFWAIGAAILNGSSRWMFGMGDSLQGPQAVQIAAILIGCGVLSGALLERARAIVGLLGTALLSGVIIPLAWHWSWSAGMVRWGLIDQAGSAFVHVAAGIVAAVAAIIVGPRRGKFNQDGSTNVVVGHGVSLTSAGVLLMWPAWSFYIVGCNILHSRLEGDVETSTGLASFNVLLAAAAAMIASCIYSRWRYLKLDIHLVYAGLLGGLVSVSGAADHLSNISAVLCGAVAGILVPFALVYMERIWKIDDPGGSIAVHAIGGIWATLAPALLVGGGIAQHFQRLGVQAVALVIIGLLSVALSLAVFMPLRAAARVRSGEADEFDGQDLAEHDVNAYPDFQQTMIKSYHLREM